MRKGEAHMAWGRLGAILVCVRREEDDDRAAPPGSERERNRGVEGVRAGEELGQGEGKGGSGPSQGLLPLIFSFSSFLIFHFLNFFFRNRK